ncbi:unnamed protein product [Lupinus luteus]|uniref:Uncharacterized protein n=1 Tax=Lupinus luteus TaxID=3873 RepID=A0AAV1XKE3_LUPLU
MELVGFVPICGNTMKKPKRNGTYHRLGNMKEVSDCSQSSNVNMVEVTPKLQVQQKIRLSTNILKRFRDAYVEETVFKK